MARRFKIGIVGLGNAVKPHALALRELATDGAVEVAGGYSPSAERRAGFTRSYGLPAADSLERLLEDRGVDAILLLTPPSTHREIASRCFAHGKHVLIEKPIDLRLDRSQALVDEAAAYRCTLGVVFQMRFRPGAVRLRELIGQERLGRLLSCSASVRWWRDDAYFASGDRCTRARDGGGVLLTQAIHTIDLLLDLVGPVAEASGCVRNGGFRPMDTEDSAAAWLRLTNGAIGTLDCTTVAFPGYAERIEIAGTRGSAVIAKARLEAHLRDGTDIVVESDSKPQGADPMAFDHGPHKLLIADFLAAIDEGRAPYSSPAAGLAVQALIERIGG